VIGITGPPGAGKSTLVNEMTRTLRSQGEKVGIIAVDPSSPYSKGAILGDRIRMNEHHADPNVFIRSTATRGRLGGTAESTMELALLLDAAGYNTLLVETVGVGQDEVEIARLADVTLLVLVPGLGDDVQAIKAGIMEIADVFAINKADLPGADRLESEIRHMQSLAPAAQRQESAPIRRVIATEGKGIDDLLAVVRVVYQTRGKKQQAELWSVRLREMMRDRLLRSLSEEDLRRHAVKVAERKEDPYAALDHLTSAMLSVPENKA